MYIYYFNNAHYHCPPHRAFSNKRPLQLSIARDQTKVNVAKFPGSLIFFSTNTNHSRFRPFFSTFDLCQLVYLLSL